MKKTFVLLLANKILLFAVALLAAFFLPFGAVYYENLATYNSGWQFLNQWSLWDANSYIQISRDWYHDQYFAYFPLYPIILKLCSYLTLGNYALAGLLLNLGLSFGSAYLLFKLCKEEFGSARKQSDPRASIIKSVRESELLAEKTGFWANAFLFFFPTAFFFTAIYTEALFLFLALAVMYFLKKKMWATVIVAAFFAAMTREVGGMLILPIAYVALKDFKGDKLKKILAILSPIMGVLAVLFLYYLSSGNPLIFLEKHQEFGKTLSMPYVPIVDAIRNLAQLNLTGLYSAWNLFCFLFTAILAWQTYKIMTKQYFLYCIAVLLPPLCSANLEGYSRYLLTAFPLFMILGSLGTHDKKYFKLVQGLYLLFVVILVVFCARYAVGWSGLISPY
jgi:hypothetical protein